MNSTSVAALYQKDPYPAMSHPTGHPSIIAATALLGGLRLPPTAQLRILEIGCSTGHHILPIAQAYPAARITAIDLSAPAIADAKRLAAHAGISNVDFLRADVNTWQAPSKAFDLIIAHGFFSWVNDNAKSALLRLCRHALVKQGVAMISYNTQPGWALRQPLREMAITLRQCNAQDNSALGAMNWIASAIGQRDDAYGRYLHEIVSDAIAKGEQQLKFDELGPVNDPCYFSQFVNWCEQAGFTYFGDADSTLAQHSLLDASAQQHLHSLAQNPLLHEQMADFLTGRTFRCSVIGHREATRHAPTAEELATLCIDPLTPIPATGNPATDTLASAIADAAPACLSLQELLEKNPTLSLDYALPVMMRLHHLGMIRLRRDAVKAPAEMPSHPRLGTLNLDHLAQGKPIVDAFHRPCRFSPSDSEWLRSCDGTRSFEHLMDACQTDKQKESLHALLTHCHERGLFVCVYT
jgi:SAM-dependent methyltransferase